MEMPPADRDDLQRSDCYVIVEGIHDRALAARACQAVLDLLMSKAARSVIDAHSDFRKAMPADAQAAEDALCARGKQQHRRDPGMNVELDLASADDWNLLSRYAPWSINVDVYDDTDDLIANLHDCGHDLTMRLTQGQADQLSRDLDGVLHIEAYEASQARERDQ